MTDILVRDTGILDGRPGFRTTRLPIDEIIGPIPA